MRKNTSILKEIWTAKILHFLPKIALKKLQDGNKLDDVKKLIIQVYSILDPSRDKRNVLSITEKLDMISPANFKAALEANKILFNIVFPPFNNMPFKPIQQAAKLLNIPLNEDVEITEHGVKTKVKVPVGFLYMGAIKYSSSREYLVIDIKKNPVNSVEHLFLI